MFISANDLSRLPAVRVPIDVLSVRDGDTIVGNVLLPCQVQTVKTAVREATYDSWELHRGRGGVIITDAELLKGKRAARDLAELLRDNTVLLEVTIPTRYDSFGRLLAKLWVLTADATVDVRDYMRERGNLRE